MQQQNLSVQDGMIMRSLVNFPGGLELHIGVRLLPVPFLPNPRFSGHRSQLLSESEGTKVEVAAQFPWRPGAAHRAGRRRNLRSAFGS